MLAIVFFPFFDPLYLILIAPAFILAMWAQNRVKKTYAEYSKVVASSAIPAHVAARRLLDAVGLNTVEVKRVPGELSDHYDPRQKVLRLSGDVYANRSLAAVGIAAHEAGHAIQDAKNYAPLVVRNAVVPVANFGSSAGIWMCILGLIFQWEPLLYFGIIVFSGVVFFQLVNLPVEFDASARAKHELVTLGIVPAAEMSYVNKVLNAAALTYVAATLQAVMTLLYFIMRARD